jgi:hypothetical protein
MNEGIDKVRIRLIKKALNSFSLCELTVKIRSKEKTGMTDKIKMMKKNGFKISSLKDF